MVTRPHSFLPGPAIDSTMHMPIMLELLLATGRGLMPWTVADRRMALRTVYPQRAVTPLSVIVGDPLRDDHPALIAP